MPPKKDTKKGGKVDDNPFPANYDPETMQKILLAPEIFSNSCESATVALEVFDHLMDSFTNHLID
jgi:hypothetical protein